MTEYDTVSGRQLVLVDVETSGLRDIDVAVEVAWWNMATGEHGVFVPEHDIAWVLRHGDPMALRLNRYRERLVDAAQDTDRLHTERLRRELGGNTLGGSNPAFDAELLQRCVTGGEKWWHHRKWDLANYTAGVFRIDPTELPGLEQVCSLLSVHNGAPHTAMGDVIATANCLSELKKRTAP